MNKKLLKTLIIIFVLAILVSLLAFGIMKAIEKRDLNKVSIKEEIGGYTLNSNHTEYYGELFSNLEDFQGENYDPLEYASLIGKLFITDFYTLDNKITRNDVGGVQFVYSDYKDTFILKAKDTVYLGLESDLYGDRDQDLPVVKKAQVIASEPTEFNDFKEAYEISLSLSYEKDYGYPEEVTLTIVLNEEKYQVAKVF